MAKKQGLYGPIKVTLERFPAAKMKRCLGWCGKEFMSPDPTKIRFCKKCRERRNNMEVSANDLFPSQVYSDA